MSRVICILGMHRSGTSAVARLVNLLGASLGDPSDLVPPSADNPEGFWENKRIVEFHDSVLQELGGTWDSLVVFDALSVDAARYLQWKEQLKDIIQSGFSDVDLWAFKDPRTCLFLPLWSEVFEEMQMDVQYVVVVRNPLDVASSLLRRNGFKKTKSFSLWYSYTLSALFWTSSRSSFVLDYDKLMDSYDQAASILSSRLGLPVSAAGVPQTLDPGLRHAHSSDADVESDDGIPESVQHLYRKTLDLGQGKTLFALNRDTDVDAEYLTYSNMASVFLDNSPDTGLAKTQFEISQVFWSTDGSYDERNSVFSSILADGQAHSYEFVFPTSIAAGFIRWDVTNFASIVNIDSIEVNCTNKTLVIPVATLTNYSGVVPLMVFPNVFLVTDNDPQISLPELSGILVDGESVVSLRITMAVERCLNPESAGRIGQSLEAVSSEPINVLLSSLNAAVDENRRLVEDNLQVSAEEARIELENRALISLNHSKLEEIQRISEQNQLILKDNQSLIRSIERISQENQRISEENRKILEKDNVLSQRNESNLIKLQESFDVYHAEVTRGNELEQRINDLLLTSIRDQEIISKLTIEKQRIVDSTSWKITRPLRWLRRHKE